MRDNVKKLLNSRNIDDIKIGLTLATDEELLSFMDNLSFSNDLLIYFSIKGEAYYIGRSFEYGHNNISKIWLSPRECKIIRKLL